jgi:hypothetical protein
VTYPTGSFAPIDGDGTKPFDYIGVGEGHVFSCFSMDIRAVRQNEAGYSKLDLAAKHQKRVTLYLHRIIASALDRSPEVHEQVDHIDRNVENNNIKNLRAIPAVQNAFRQSSKEEQAALGYEPKTRYMKTPIVKHTCEKQADAWTDIGSLDDDFIPGLELSIVGNVRDKASKEYKEHTVNTDTGYHSITLYCDKNKPHIFSIHKLVGKVFNLHHEEHPVKNVSQDPRRFQTPTAHLYLTGAHIDPSKDHNLVIDHIDEVKSNNSVANLRFVTQRDNMIASSGKACTIFDPETNGRQDYRSISLAQDDVGHRFDMPGGKRGRYIIGKRKSKAMLWKGEIRKKLWFSFLDQIFFFYFIVNV